MPRIKQAPAFTASAMRVDIADVSKLKRSRQQWQTQAWDYWDLIGEVKYAIGAYTGGAIQKIRIFPAVQTEDDSDPEPANNEVASELMDRLRGESGGHGQMLKTIAINLSVAGECYLIGLANEGELDSWEIYSIDEVKMDNAGKVTLQTDDGLQSGRVLTDDDFVLRIWLKHPRKRSLPDSPLHGVLDVCEQLLTYSLELKALSRSRVSGAGVYWIPSEMDFKDKDGNPSVTAFAESLTENMMMPIENPGAASSVVPFVVSAAGELIEKVRYEKFDRATDEKLDQRIEAALRRLAQGLTTPPEIVLGIADVNHWNALYISEDAFKTGVEGLLLEILWALTSGYLRPMMAEMGSTEEISLWYDASEVTRRPNTAENAIKGHEMLLISDEAARRDLGFSEDDAPTPEEVALKTESKKFALVGVPTVVQAQLATINEGRDALGLPPIPDGDRMMTAEEIAAIRGPAQGAPPIAASIRAAASPLGVQLATLDQSLRERLWVASDMALRRMIEKVGSRAKAKVNSRKDKALSLIIKDVDVLNVPATLGPATVKSLGINLDEYLTDAFADIEKKWDQWTSEAGKQALNLVPNLSERKSPELQLESFRAEGWAVLDAGLKEIAGVRLFAPTPDAPAQGETSSGNLVPFGLIRRAVATAGGGNQQVRRAALTKGLFTSGEGDAWTSLGLATGSFLRDLFSDNGVKTTGYVWDYGLFARSRPFDPHEDLEGQFFENFDDDILKNTTGWPEVDFFSPGDHSGCQCDFQPVMSE